MYKRLRGQELTQESIAKCIDVWITLTMNEIWIIRYPLACDESIYDKKRDSQLKWL